MEAKRGRGTALRKPARDLDPIERVTESLLKLCKIEELTQRKLPVDIRMVRELRMGDRVNHSALSRRHGELGRATLDNDSASLNLGCGQQPPIRQIQGFVVKLDGGDGAGATERRMM